MRKSINCLTLATILLLAVIFSFGTSFKGVAKADYSLTDGITFSANEYYEITKKLQKMPQTFETEIYVSQGLSGRIGDIFSNYNSGLASSISLDIVDGGKPCLYYDTANGQTWNRVVNYDVRTGGWVHLTVVNDQQNNEFICYINGVEVDRTISATYAKDIEVNFIIGGDNRADNSSYFKGRIRSLALYSDVRTPAEIASDINYGADKNDANVIAVYDMPSTLSKNDVPDLSGNGYDVNYGKAFYTEKQEVTDYAYSFVAIGDTQNICEDEPEKMDIIYNWILNNINSKKIAHVFGLGDITDMNTQEEWDVAKNAISKLNGKVSYSLVRGNHDITYMFNKTFNNSDYTSQFGGFYEEGKIDSSWKTFTVSNTDYLFITLDYGADDNELAWASRIIEAFPNHRVIITTHAYMYSDGTQVSETDEVVPSDSTDVNYSPIKQYNNGDEMWDKLISKHGNIFLVMSGHVSCNNVVTTQRKGIHGNTVTQMLIDPQELDKTLGATGMVTVLYFANDGSVINVETYSTVKQAYYKETNQYVLNVYDTAVNAHNANNNYLYDDVSHWQVCEDCKVNVRDYHHLGEWQTVKQATINEKGEQRRTCECGYYESQEVPKLEDTSAGDPSTGESGSSSQGGGEQNGDKKPGCGGFLGSSLASVILAVISSAYLFVNNKKRNK